MFGDKAFGKNEGYPTPESTPGTVTCLRLRIPANPAWWAIYTGLIYALTFENAWQQFEGGITREDAAHCALEIYSEALENATQSDSCGDEVPTPFWDDATDLDDEASPETQLWYGKVTNPDAPPDEITFLEDAAIWALTGFIAYSGEVGGAIWFRTIAPKFVLAFHKGDLREIWRVVVGAADYGQIDTDDYDAGEIIQMPIVADEEAEFNDIYIIQMDVP